MGEDMSPPLATLSARADHSRRAYDYADALRAQYVSGGLPGVSYNQVKQFLGMTRWDLHAAEGRLQEAEARACRIGRGSLRLMTGLFVGRLIVVGPVRDAENKRLVGAKWVCRCRCGSVVQVRAKHLNRPKPTKSCGCLRSETARETICTWNERRGSTRSTT